MAAVSSSGFRVLLVEDNADSRAAAEADILELIPSADIAWAGDSGSALQMVRESQFDLAVCDLKLPAQVGQLATSETNGLAVVALLRELQPGTPVVILSAYGTVEDTEPYTAGAELLSAHGAQRLRMCQVAVKAVPGGFSRRLEPIRDGLAKIAELDFVAPDDLDWMLRRAISQFAVDRGLSQVEVTSAGGLSGSSNAIVVMRRSGAPEMRAFVKLDESGWILDELDRRKKFVEGYIDSSNWAATIDIVRAGLRGRAAYFSSLASDPTTFFALSADDETATATVVDGLERALNVWALSETRTTTVGDLRRDHLSDSELQALGISLDEFAEVEALEVELDLHVCHGDLHGENVLVVDGARPVIVDFAYTGVEPCGFDPLTLEMSFLFHPGSPLVRAGAAVRYQNWASGDYLVDNRFQEITARCRAWSLAETSRTQHLVLSYSHAIRHLKREVPVERVFDVARSAAVALLTVSN